MPKPRRSRNIPGGTFEAEGHIYRDTKQARVLSVTQVFEALGLNDYSRVPPEILLRKQQVGVAVHRAIELLVEGTLDWETVDEDAMMYVVGAQRWLEHVHFIPEATEEQGICESRGMKYGYQIDLRGRMLYEGQFRPCIIDLKTALEVSPTWALQTAAYAHAAPVINQRYLRVALHLGPDSMAKPIVYDYTSKDETTFLYMLYCAIWKWNNGYPLKGAECDGISNL